MENLNVKSDLDNLKSQVSKSEYKDLILFRAGARDKETEVLFAQKCFSAVWESVERLNENPMLARSDIVELLFFGQTFSLNTPNTDLKWVKDSKRTDYRYKNSKPNIENGKWVAKADEFRKCLIAQRDKLAVETVEKNYIFNWKDLYRTSLCVQIMAPVCHRVLEVEPNMRNLIFRHGFVQAVPLSVYTQIYLTSNILILRTFNAMKEHLTKDGEFFKLKPNSTVDSLKKVFTNEVIPNFMSIPKDRLVSVASFVTYGMHVSSTRFKEMGIFKRKDLSDEVRKKAEDAVSQAVNTVHKLCSAALGDNTIKFDHDLNSMQENVASLRDVIRKIYCMKHSIVGYILSSSRGFTQKYVAVSDNTGGKAMKPLINEF